MTIDEAQKQVDEWIKTVGVRYFSELTNMACLTEEVGELAVSWPAATATSLSRKAKTATWKKRWPTYFGY